MSIQCSVVTAQHQQLQKLPSFLPSKRREMRDEGGTAQWDLVEKSNMRSEGFAEYECTKSPCLSLCGEKETSTHKLDQATKPKQKQKEMVDKRAETSCSNETHTHTRQNSSFTKQELETFCNRLGQSIKARNPQKFRRIVQEYENRLWRHPFNGDEFIAHPGYEETLEDIRLSFQLNYVDKNLHMVGYFEDSGSDLYLMVDDDGKVYRAEGDILYVFENNLHDYMTHGSKEDPRHYDYYGRLSPTKALDCVGWSNQEEEDKLCSSPENDQKVSDTSDGEGVCSL
ncbi:uncharacterized protein [Ptychodera flava]|uniref:uncharacterized protein isoform X2 n=1 Tax=Ptychodera flava TaxID=63121 RepID=UPI003969F57A